MFRSLQPRTQSDSRFTSSGVAARSSPVARSWIQVWVGCSCIESFASTTPVLMSHGAWKSWS